MDKEELDLEAINEDINKIAPVKVKKRMPVNSKPVYTQEDQEELESCLTNERVIIRHVPKETGIQNPKHILSGGMAEGAFKCFTVPCLQSGVLVNILTDKEKAFLENLMGLEYNALSIYKKENNYWRNFQVRLEKRDNYLDLSDPYDYIKYKVLLANKDFIAESLDTLETSPKVTYQFVIIHEQDESIKLKSQLSRTNDCFLQLGKISEDFYTLKSLVESIEGRPVSNKTKVETLQDKLYKYVQSDSKLLFSLLKDPLLPNKVLINKGIEKGVISNRGGFYYIKESNDPLCGNGEEPTLKTAATYIGLAKNQTLKFSIQEKVK